MSFLCLLDAFWKPSGLGAPGRSWVVPGRLGVDFRDFPENYGGLLVPFWVLFYVFLVIVWALFFDRVFKRFCIDVGVILESYLESFLDVFPSSRKMLHPTKVL